MNHLLLSGCVILGLLTPGLAQGTQFVPLSSQGSELSSSTSSPLFRNAAERALYVYDDSHWSDSGVRSAIRIERLRLRADGAVGSWSGAVMANLRIDMSHAAVDHASAVESFDANHGLDRITVYDGPVTILAGSNVGGAPGATLVEIVLATPFVFDPARGDDLVIDYVTSGLATTAGSFPLDADNTTAGRATRVVASDPLATSGTVGFSAHAMELDYSVAQGVFAAFAADVRRGPSPLTVQFTDRSSSTDAGGITTWEWDFDGDGQTDSTAQNPIFVYAGCGSFSPRLTVTTAAGSAALERPDHIVTDEVQAAFTADVRTGSSPLTVQFTDQSAGSPTSWEWDFDGDGQVDSSLQNPQFVFGPGAHTVSLTVGRSCRTSTETKVDFIVALRGLETLFQGNNGINPPGGVFFDASVHSPGGLSVTALDVHCREDAGFAFDAEIFVTSTSYVGKDDDPSHWRLVATGSAVSAGLGSPTFLDVGDFFLPQGDYGIAIYFTNARQRYTDGTGANQAYGNADLSLSLGVSRADRFSGQQYAPRVWNGAIYYELDLGNIYSFFGEGCSGSAGVASLTELPGSQLELGGTFNLEVGPVPPADIGAYLLLGYNRSFAGSLTLPLDLTPFGLAGCTLWSEPFVAFFLPNNGGICVWNAQIPVAANLVGQRIYNQAFVFDRASGRSVAAVMSDAASGVIGN